MSQQILDKIRYLCQLISKVEWSGVLYYSVQGSIENPSEMVVTLEEIFPMDRGSAGYTAYDYSDHPELFDFMIANPQIMDGTWKIGHIHSHHNMGVFFSSTDMDELNDNSASHNYYLSLIINNRMDFITKIAFRGEVSVPNIPIEYVCKKEEGKEYIITDEIKAFTRTKLFVLDCIMDTPDINPNVSPEFKSRVDDIIKEAEIKEAKIKEKEAETKIYQSNGQHNYQGSQGIASPFTKADRDSDKGWSNTNWDNLEGQEQYPIELSGQNLVYTEDFVAYILRGGISPEVDGSIKPEDNLADAIEEMEVSKIEPNGLATAIIDNFTTYYEAFFETDGSFDQFSIILKEVIDIVDTESDTCSQLKPLLTQLQAFSADVNKPQVS